MINSVIAEIMYLSFEFRISDTTKWDFLQNTLESVISTIK